MVSTNLIVSLVALAIIVFVLALFFGGIFSFALELLIVIIVVVVIIAILFIVLGSIGHRHI